MHDHTDRQPSASIKSLLESLEKSLKEEAKSEEAVCMFRNGRLWG